MMTVSVTQRADELPPKIVKILHEIGGDYCVKVGKTLFEVNKEKEITDENLAKLCGIKLNIVRKILYVLYENKLSSFRKIKDKKSGWYIYYWHESFDNLDNFIKRRQELVLDKLRSRLEYEKGNQFYICKKPVKKKVKKIVEDKIVESFEEMPCNTVLTFDEAFDQQFTCPKCGSPMEYYDNSRVKEFLENKIADILGSMKSG